jgi:lipoate-protein ligase A
MIVFDDRDVSDIAFNVAVDEALLVACEEGLLGDHRSAARLWRQPSWAVVLGASGKVGEDVRLEECRRRGVPVARRSSGGGTVLLGPGSLCLAWVRPLADFPHEKRDVRELQVMMLNEIAEMVRPFEPRLRVVASGDWAIDGRKCAGSAQRRMKSHVLVHLSLLNRMPLKEIPVFLKEPARRPDYRSDRDHATFLTNLGIDTGPLQQALVCFPGDVELCAKIPENVANLADRLADERFRLAEWTFRF